MKRLNQFNSSSILTAVGVFFSRLGLLSANVSPLGSFGFFSGSPWLYVLSIFGFDYFIGGFYTGFVWTYLGFAAYPVVGFFARKRGLAQQAQMLPLASALFFLISNFGVWWHWYPHTWSGLLTCYTLAVPFFWRTLLGDVVFGYSYLVFKSGFPGKIWQKIPRVFFFGQSQSV